LTQPATLSDRANSLLSSQTLENAVFLQENVFLAKTYNPGLRIFMPISDIQLFHTFQLFSINLAADIDIDI
jgi:hypothetical protein